MMERTEEVALSGLLNLNVGGRTLQLPTLKLRQSREWKARLSEALTNIDIPEDAAPAAFLAAIASTPSDVALDLVLAYDVTHALGDRDGIEDTFTDADLFRALEVMVKATYPFVQDVRSVAEAFGPQLRLIGRALLAQAAETLSRASSTNGASPIGDSTPTPLRDVSPTSSSSSSGRTARNGSPASVTSA